MKMGVLLIDMGPSTPPSDLTRPTYVPGGLSRFSSQMWEDTAAAVPRPDDRSSLASLQGGKNYSLLTKCIAEFVGDFTFVFVGTMQAYVTLGQADNIVHAALAHGFTIFILVATLGHISGGHFNPVVTWAVTALGKIPFYHFPCYMFAQLLGGFCGGLMSALLQNQRERTKPNVPPELAEELFRLLNSSRLMQAIMTSNELQETYAGATLLDSTRNTWWEGLLSEAVVSYFLVHTILNTAVDTDKNILAPLAIGLTLSIDIFATGKITGASMNPARSLGPNIVGSIFLKTLPAGFWGYHYIYWAGPFLGSTVAVILFKLFEERNGRIIR